MRIFFTCTTSHHGREIRREIDPPTAPPHAKAFPHNDIHLAGDAAYHGKPLLVPAATITELQASEELRAAAETLSKNPASLQLRYLQTLLELGADQNSTVVFPLPVDIIEPFLKHPRMLESIATALNNSG